MQKEWQIKIREKLRQVAPGVFVIMLVLGSRFHYPLPGISLVFPLFLAMAVYYWSLFGHAFFPLWFVFLMGLLQDILTGLPLGVSALTYSGLWWLVQSQRRYLTKEPFLVIWFGFAVAVSLLGVVTWMVLSLYYATPMPWQDAAVQLILTVLFYPAAHLVFTQFMMSLMKAH